MNYELLYTSAPQGLKQGSRGFCTVLATAGIPINLAQKLESISGYRHLYQPGDERASANPVCCSHLRFILAGRNVSVISRIAAYGFDYSQRSNKIAHHIVIEGTLPQCGPAALLKESGIMRSEWDQLCRSVTKGPELPELDLQPQICQRWQEMTGDAGWAGTVAANWLSPTAKPMWIVFAEDQANALLDLMLEAIALLPYQQRWRATFSTYCNNLPPDIDCRVRCVLSGSDEARVAKSRGMVIDLTKAMPPAIASPEVQAAREGAIIVPSEQETSQDAIDPWTDIEEAPTPSIATIEEPAEFSLEDIPPAILPTTAFATPPNVAARQSRNAKSANRWLTPTLISVCLVLAVAAIYLTIQVIGPYPNVLVEEQAAAIALSKANDSVANTKVVDSGSTTSVLPKSERAVEIADVRPKPNETQEPKPASIDESTKPELVFHAIGDKAKSNIATVTFTEQQMRGRLEIASVMLQGSDTLPTTDSIKLSSELGSELKYEKGMLVWQGNPDFRMKPSNEGLSITVTFDRDGEAITKDLSLVVTNTPDPDVELTLTPDNTLLANVVVAGVRLGTSTTMDLDEVESSGREWVWQRAGAPIAHEGRENEIGKDSDARLGEKLAEDLGKESGAAEQIQWMPIPNERGNNYVVKVDDYGCKLRCKLAYKEVSGSSKSVYSNEIDCLPRAVLSYEFADLVNMPSNRVKGTIEMDLAVLNVPGAAKASWRLNGNKIALNEGRVQFKFDLGSVMPGITEPVKAWSQNVADAKEAVRENISKLHKLYETRLEGASIPRDSDMGRAYLLSASKNQDAIEFIEQFEDLGEFERTVGRFLMMHSAQEIGSPEYMKLKAGLVVSNDLYPNRNERSANDAAAQLERLDVLMSYARIGTNPSEQSQNNEASSLRTDTQGKISSLKKMLRQPIQLNQTNELPKISIIKPPEEGSLERPKELISFPIALKLQINPDQRYSKFVAEQ